MTRLYGADYGEGLNCRVCQYDRFLVERGSGTVNGNPISVLTIRCSRCGTVMEQLNISWKDSVKPGDGNVVAVEDGIRRA